MRMTDTRETRLGYIRFRKLEADVLGFYFETYGLHYDLAKEMLNELIRLNSELMWENIDLYVTHPRFDQPDYEDYLEGVCDQWILPR